MRITRISRVSIFFMLIGVAIAVTGLILLKVISEPEGVMRTLPYLCVGVGCGMFGHFMGELIEQRHYKKYPEMSKKIEIEKKDERNIAISNRAKAKAYDIMIFVYGALMLTLGLMGGDIAIVLMLVGAYLFVVFSGIYFRIKYEKEM